MLLIGHSLIAWVTLVWESRLAFDKRGLMYDFSPLGY
jgi:hypothetical protein